MGNYDWGEWRVSMLFLWKAEVINEAQFDRIMAESGEWLGMRYGEIAEQLESELREDA